MSKPETWATGEMVCLSCGANEGIHVWLIDSEPVECHKCGDVLCVPVDGFEDAQTLHPEYEE